MGDKHPSLAVREGTSPAAFAVRQLHSLDRQSQGNLQDRGFRQGRHTVGKEKEPSRHELRQVVPVPKTILQEGDHEEDGEESETGLPVLPSLPPLTLTVVTVAALPLRAGIMF